MLTTTDALMTAYAAGTIFVCILVLLWNHEMKGPHEGKMEFKNRDN